MNARALTTDEIEKGSNREATVSPVVPVQELRFVCANCQTENEDGFCNTCGHFAFEVAG